MSLRNDRAVTQVMNAARARKVKNLNIFGHTPLPNKTQTLVTIMAVADAIKMPMIDLVDKILNQGGET
ncbi:hypothetical protein CPT_Piffle_047 [Stenotrophomonas phage Piffle]|uniref:Uncharacterized protein n=1 Tax=Stenotrophomonas phage Piffle TaxID=2859656 RepID=A0AAE8BJB1_9CAUD|nr:hypothetical protein PP762_gp85 [Stenotrophomonas phage Piffle]QYW01901.1 hypothetical protein CPT_Piffle_047 [Stenotrophomonas phage Piffle]